MQVPQSSRQLAHEGDKVVNPMHQPSLPQTTPLVLFLLEAESTPATMLTSMKNPNDPNEKLTHNFPADCAVSQPNAPPSTPCYSLVLSQVSSYNIQGKVVPASTSKSCGGVKL